MTVISWLNKHWFLIFCILGFILVRTPHFAERLNFSTDQAEFSRRAVQLWRAKELTFTGPTASYNYDGHYLRQSSVIFYATMFFLVPFNFSPIPASYQFSVLASLMCVPLYVGMKKLSNQAAAELITGLFAFLPFYINYTTFLWNPNFQLTLFPLLIFSLGKFREKLSNRWLFLSGIMAGLLLLFHYQFILIIVALSLGLFYFFFKKKLVIKHWLLWVCGLVIGGMPLILFEVRSQFYNFKTVWLLLQHGSDTTADFAPHYVLVLSFIGLCLGVGLIFSNRLVTIPVQVIRLIVLSLFAYSLLIRLPAPQGAFGMPIQWNYVLEEKANHIIQNQRLEKYAVVNNLYETKATVQYFLLERDQVSGWTADYTSNNYLFIITTQGKTDFQKESAYEMASFIPAVEVKRWELAPGFEVVLLKRRG